MTGLATTAALLLASLPASHAASGAQDAGDMDIVAIQPDASDRMTVSVQIGTRGPYRFLLDTGSQNTVVATSLASQLALPPGRRATIVSVAGRQVVSTVEVDEIVLGKRSYYGLLAPLLERHDIGADGILGLDSLQNQRVLLDFRQNLIAVDDAKALGGDSGYEIVVRARRRQGQLIMADAVIDGVRTNVVIDTGADFTIGNRALQRALGRRKPREQAMLNSVTGQQILADIGHARELAIGKLTVRNVGIAFTDAPPFAALDLERRPALLLGMRELRAFKRVAIDFSSRKVLFDMPAGF